MVTDTPCLKARAPAQIEESCLYRLTFAARAVALMRHGVFTIINRC